MKEEDYLECNYINYEMKFYGFEDFIKSATYIKKQYSNLKNKIFYKWFVYAQPINQRQKNAIWEYLNEDITLEELKKI